MFNDNFISNLLILTTYNNKYDWRNIMSELARFFNIPNIKIIQQEIWSFVKPEMLTDQTRGFTIKENDLFSNAPTLMSWFSKTFDHQPVMHRLYVTSPQGNLRHHIDGFMKLPAMYSLNIPIHNCIGTKHIYWKCDDDNKINGCDDKGENRSKYGARFVIPKDIDKLEKINSYELTHPCFFRNDVMHSVENPTLDHRIVFAVRWELAPNKFRKLSDFVDYSKIDWID